MLTIANYAWKTIGAGPPGWPSTTTDANPKTKVRWSTQVARNRPLRLSDHVISIALQTMLTWSKRERKRKRKQDQTCKQPARRGTELRQWLSLSAEREKGNPTEHFICKEACTT